MQKDAVGSVCVYCSVLPAGIVKKADVPKQMLEL